MVNITVIGCGYLGAVHAASMAAIGHDVIGIDTREDHLAALARGEAPFYEPGLPQMLDDAVRTSRLRFATSLEEFSPNGSGPTVHFVCVGTPQMQHGAGYDLSQLYEAMDALRPHLRAGDVVVGKSTVSPGTAAVLAADLAESDPQVALVWNPEFLREGHAIEDTLRPDRIVYGTHTGTSSSPGVDLLDTVYEKLLADGVPRLLTTYATAELIKSAANAFLATKVSFVNAVADMCTAVGADIGDLQRALGGDPRIGSLYLQSGPGFGGGCLPKDIRGLASSAAEHGVSRLAALLQVVDDINAGRRRRVVELVVEALAHGRTALGRAPRVAVLGLAFKADSDDMRDSPGVDVARRLLAAGYDVVAHDPQALHKVREELPGIELCAQDTPICSGADLVLVMTDWRDYVDLEPASLEGAPGRVVVDTRLCLDARAWRAAGWRYLTMASPSGSAVSA